MVDLWIIISFFNNTGYTELNGRIIVNEFKLRMQSEQISGNVPAFLYRVHPVAYFADYSIVFCTV
jgi:hypothetical protein